MKLGVVLLAAGRSERFGSNKLLADFSGRPLICRALEAAKSVSAQKVCVVTGSEAVRTYARQYGFDVRENPDAHLGQSHSIHLGIEAMREMDAALLMVCDQPGLTGESLARLTDAFAASGKGMACLRDDTHMGNPAIFSKEYYPQLLALSGDRGAKGILLKNPDDLLTVSCTYAHELDDADTPQALENILQRN